MEATPVVNPNVSSQPNLIERLEVMTNDCIFRSRPSLAVTMQMYDSQARDSNTIESYGRSIGIDR